MGLLDGVGSSGCVSSGASNFSVPPDVKGTLQAVGDAARSLQQAAAAGDTAGVKSAASSLSAALQKMGLCKAANTADNVAKTGSLDGLAPADLKELQGLTKFGTPKPVAQTQAAVKPINWGYSNVSAFG
jgi:hypothetical protein